MRGGGVHSYLPANTHHGQSHPWQMSPQAAVSPPLGGGQATLCGRW
jgi:hypothetical protein